MDVEFILKFLALLIVVIVIIRIYMFIARYVGEQIRAFLIDMWQKVKNK